MVADNIPMRLNLQNHVFTFTSRHVCIDDGTKSQSVEEILLKFWNIEDEKPTLSQDDQLVEQIFFTTKILPDGF